MKHVLMLLSLALATGCAQRSAINAPMGSGETSSMTTQGAGAREIGSSRYREADSGTPLPAAAGAASEPASATSKGAGAESLQNAVGNELTPEDAEFLRSAARAGLAEVRMGQLAAQNAENEKVKEFGRRLIEDHTQANEELASLLTRKGITTPMASSLRDQQMLRRLSNLNGMEFDRVCQRSAVQSHVEAVRSFKLAAQRTNGDPEVKAFAQKYLPIFEEHLNQARRLNAQPK